MQFLHDISHHIAPLSGNSQRRNLQVWRFTIGCRRLPSTHRTYISPGRVDKARKFFDQMPVHCRLIVSQLAQV
jgi:hypothetical protein